MLEKSSIISVRVHDEIKQKLVIESALESLTLNTLVSRTLTRHVEWDKFTDDLGFVFVTKQFLRSVLESIPEKIIVDIALTICRNAFKDIVTYMHGSFSIDNLTKCLDLWLNSSHISFRHMIGEGNDVYVIQHELGIGWTTYFSTLVNVLLNDAGYKTINETKTQQSISFEIKKIDFFNK